MSRGIGGRGRVEDQNADILFPLNGVAGHAGERLPFRV